MKHRIVTHFINIALVSLLASNSFAQAEEASTSTLSCIPAFLEVEKAYYFRFSGSRNEVLMRVKQIPGDSCWIKVKERLSSDIPEEKFAGHKTKAYWIYTENLDAIKPKSAVSTSQKTTKSFVPDAFKVGEK